MNPRTHLEAGRARVTDNGLGAPDRTGRSIECGHEPVPGCVPFDSVEFGQSFAYCASMLIEQRDPPRVTHCCSVRGCADEICEQDCRKYAAWRGGGPHAGNEFGDFLE